MYNEELKNRFIEDYTASEKMRKLCVVIFNKIEPYEERYGVDVCAMDNESLKSMVGEIINGVRSRSKWSCISILKAYAKFCTKEQIPNTNDNVLRLDAETLGIDALKKRMVSFPLSLQNYLNDICAPESLQATDNIYRCFYWLAYMGMPEEDIMNVKTSDVNFDNLTITFKGKT